jgi:uncharacterized protein Yka (UPF0111/DUF47 family)|nr:hypothetical protein [bacterium]
MQELLYTNIDEKSKLYPLLSTAVNNNKFPNLKIALPLTKPAYESDLADLIKNNFNKKISYTDKKVLTFDFLQTQLKDVYSIQKEIKKVEKANDQIAESVLYLLKENYINKDQLS